MGVVAAVLFVAAPLTVQLVAPDFDPSDVSYTCRSSASCA